MWGTSPKCQKTTCLFLLQFFYNVTDEDWGGKCSTGNRQSPIDLVKDVAVSGRYTGFQFQNYDSPMKSPTIVNNGHSSKSN